MMKSKRMKITAVFVLLLQIFHCCAHADGNFLIYNAYKNKCLTDNLQWLDTCNPISTRQQFRWASEDQIFNIAQKKCLGIGSRKEGNKLQWYICNDKNDLQKWQCRINSQFSVKNESLYLSLLGETNSLTLSKKQNDKSQWTIHGTTDDICSQPYQELYSLRGNGFGRPCKFPFMYENKWYSDCSTKDSGHVRPWCAIESIYENNQLWGYCPTHQIDDFWHKNPLTGSYYQINTESALTWYQARQSCQQQGGDLSSITDVHEQALISGLVQGNGPTLWTGLNSLGSSSGWHWINGKPLRYLNWLSGHPSPQIGRNCGAINPQSDSKWSTDVCSAKHGYICQKDPPTPTIPPVVHTGSCPRPWIPYSGHCYYLNRAKKTWLEARDACRRDGGDLLSILNVEEQSFAISQLGYVKTDELWIGLNDLKTAMLFEWSDHSDVPFVSWEKNEPSHTADNKQDCVLIKGEEGKWTDEICKNKYGFICKKDTNSGPSANDTLVTSPGCKPGWTRYGYYCYFIGTETKTFDEAKQSCANTDSYLVDIANRVENAFLVSLVGMRPEKHFWIGLSNIKNHHMFVWNNNQKVLYTHFNTGMPGRKHGCVGFNTGTFAGLWDVLSCTNKEKYICKRMAEDFVTTLAPTTVAPPNCSDEWVPAKERDICIKMFKVEDNQRKTWSEALSFCRELGGDLLSLHSDGDLDNLNNIYSRGAWIGYSIQDPSVGYEWSDGSPTSFENWQDGEPNNFNNMENCAEITFWWWSKRSEWNDVHCKDGKDWVCQIQRGVTPHEVEITTKTYNITDDGWTIYNGNQYYFSKYTYLPMQEARWFCKQRHGDLVVINDEEERIFLWHQFTYEHYFIGLIVDLDKSFTWMDGSPVVYEAWQLNQPALLNNEERCVQIYQGVWETVNCGEPLGFICKRSGSVEVNSTAAPTEAPRGGCPPQWVKFQTKCYRIEEELKTWTEARTYCRNNGGDLTSITSSLQQAFLVLKTDESNKDFWIGFSNLAKRGFKWTDGSHVSYTAWARDQPSRDEHFWQMGIEEGICTAMGNMEKLEMGKWKTKDCNETMGFICSRPIEQGEEPIPTKIPTTFVNLRNDSYMILQKNLTWNEAKRQCELAGSHLASIRDFFAQAYIELQTSKLGQPLWIGLNSMKTDGYFLWIDNWQLNMERWGRNEPQSRKPCVYVDVDGQWKTAYCNQTSYSICKKSPDVAPTTPMQYPGVCPEIDENEPYMAWVPFRGHCYAFVVSSTSWSKASQMCLARDATLVSIEDTKEAKFIENYITFLGDDYDTFSIGLFKTHTDRWMWLDRSVVDYTNWGESSEYDGYDYDCASISTKTKQWQKQHCLYNHSPFICKTAKVAKPTTALQIHPTDTPGTHRNLAAKVVVVMIAVLVILAGLVYMYRRRSRVQRAVASFDNLTYCNRETRDTKLLVDNMENNE